MRLHIIRGKFPLRNDKAIRPRSGEMNRRNLEKKIKILKLDVRDTEALLEKFSDFKSSGLTIYGVFLRRKGMPSASVCSLTFLEI